jgi:hypothetical protein
MSRPTTSGSTRCATGCSASPTSCARRPSWPGCRPGCRPNALLMPGPGGHAHAVGAAAAYGEGQRLLLTQDITERERADAMRRDFVANVSHEIRTPLTVLAGFVETMASLPLTEAERQRVLGLMTQQTERMQALVADLLTLASWKAARARHRPVARRRGVLTRWWPTAALSRRRHEIELDVSAGRCRAGGQPHTSCSAPSATWSATPCATRPRVAASGCGWLARRRRCRDRGQRHRARHRARTHPAADRALLPRRRQPLARDRRHRAGPGHRQARGAAPRRRTGDRQRTRQGRASGWCCRRRGCVERRTGWRPMSRGLQFGAGCGGRPRCARRGRSGGAGRPAVASRRQAVSRPQSGHAQQVGRSRPRRRRAGVDAPAAQMLECGHQRGRGARCGDAGLGGTCCAMRSTSARLLRA